MRTGNFIDLTSPRIDTLGRVYKNNKIIVHSGDILKAASGIYTVTQVDYKHDGVFVTLLKSMNRISDGTKNYFMVEMSELYNIDNLVKDAMASTTTGANNPINSGKDEEDTVEKSGSGGMTNAEEGIVDPVGLAEKKRREINDKLLDTLEHTKGFGLRESQVNPPRQLITKTLNSFDVDLPYGLKYVTNKGIQEEDSKNSKKKDPLDKEESDSEENGFDNDKDSEEGFEDQKKPEFAGEIDPDEGNNLEPVPDPTVNLAPNYNSYLYPFGKEEEQRVPTGMNKEEKPIKDKESNEGLDESGVSEDAFSQEGGDFSASK